MRSKSTIINNKRTIAAVSITAIMAMVLMPLLVKSAMADNGEDAEVCSQETVPDTSGKADYVYKLDTDCTLHIGPTNIPSRNEPSPIQQHDKVRKIIFDGPERTSLDEYSSYLFYGYPNVKSIEGLDKLDVSHVMQFANTFAGLNLEEPADLSSWNVSAAWNFQSMFQGSNLDGFKGIDNFTFNLSNKVQWYAKDFQLMFKDATSTKGIDLSGWTFLNPNESNGVMFGSMFEGAKIPRIDVSSFSDLDIGAGATSMFANTNADIEGLDRFPVQTMITADRMFENAKPTNHIDLSSWDTSRLESTMEMFKGSDIDKFSGMDKWNLDSLANASWMYANLNPSDSVYIQTNLPRLVTGMYMFAYSNLDMFPDIGKLQLSDQCFSPEGLSRMFENSKATYVKMSDWKNGGYSIYGMLASPNIKYTTFGNKTIGDGPDSDFVLWEASTLFEGLIDASDPGYQMTNVWDRPDLPKEYSAKKWATLPIKPECDVQFDGDPNHLPKDCWDESQSWVSDKTGKEADEELLDNTTKHYQRIFFRLETIPVNFNANGVENIQDLPNSYSFDRLYKNNEGLIPSNTPVDPSGAREFLSWNTQADGKGKTYHPGDQVGYDVKSLDLYAQWKNKAPTIQFNNNGGEGTTPETKPSTDDTKIAVDCTNTPSKDGATFIGWSKTKNDVLEGSEAGEKGQIVVCGYSGKRTLTGLQGRTIDLYATWARNPNAVFRENRPNNMTALLPETKTITGDWYVDDSTPRTYVAPNVEGWYKGYSPDGVWQFDGWVSEDGSPFTGAYLERNDLTINAKWTKIKTADVPSEDNNHTDDNEQDHDDNQDNNKPSDDNDNSTSGSNSDNHGSNDNDNPHKDPVIEEKPSVPGNGAGLGGIPSISNTSNQMIDDSDSGDKPNIEDKGTTNSSNEDTAADSDRSDEDSQLAKTGIGMAIPVIMIIVSMAAFIITRRLKRKA